MKLHDLTREELVLPRVVAHSKGDAFRQLLAPALRFAPQLDPEQVLHLLLERERKGSTSIGRGIAVPHATVPGLTEPLLVVGRLDPPIDGDAIDGEPVRLMFVLLNPPDSSHHVRMLSRIARLCLDDDVIRELHEAATAADAVRRLNAADDHRR